MKMKNFLTVILLAVTFTFQAQNDEKRDKIKALKTAYFTTELSLNSEESAKFWPIYNAFDDKQFELRHRKMKSLANKLKNSIDTMSDKEALVILNQMEDYDQELFENRKKLVTNLKPIISAVKILKLKKAEDDFNRTLLKQYKGKNRKE